MRLTINKTLTVALCLTLLRSLPAQSSSTPFTAIPSFRISASPVRIVSFAGIVNNNKVLLSWTIEGNQEADKFEVEKSIDGKPFVMAALVFGTDKTDKDDYQFYEKKTKAKITYRIKVIQKNGTISYSQVIEAVANTIK
jgi:hypothetical protein